MGFEQAEIQEIGKSIYQQIKEDRILSEDEKGVLEKKYTQEQAEVHTTTKNDLAELHQFMDIFQESLLYTPEEIKKIQNIIGILPDHQDGKFGPQTFLAYLEYHKNHASFGTLQAILYPEKNTSVSHIPGDQHPETLDPSNISADTLSENENPEEKIKKLKDDAKKYPKTLLKQLQEHLGELVVDGSFGQKSTERLLIVYPEITSLEEAFQKAAINTDIDGILSPDGNPEAFRELYGEYIQKLGDDLGLPLGFIEAIIKQETTYGADLVSNTGSHGLMQLTRWPFKDMRGDSGDKIGVSPDTVRHYQEIFKKIDFDALLEIQIGEKGMARTRMPQEVIDAFLTIQKSENIPEIQEKITFLYEYLKKNGADFHDHEANMIIGSVYLASLYEKHNSDIETTAREYNSSPNEMKAYGRNVKKFYNDIVTENTPNIS